MNCPNCQTENPDAAKFCMNCGNRLMSDVAAGERSQFKLGRYLPQELISILEAARKQLFVDWIQTQAESLHEVGLAETFMNQPRIKKLMQ